MTLQSSLRKIYLKNSKMEAQKHSCKKAVLETNFDDILFFEKKNVIKICFQNRLFMIPFKT